MKEHLVQCHKSLLPLLKCLKPPIDGSEIHSAVPLVPPSQLPDPLAIEAELLVLAELLPSDIDKDYNKVVEVSAANKLPLPLANLMIRFNAYSSCDCGIKRTFIQSIKICEE